MLSAGSDVIEKGLDRLAVPPNLPDYEAACRDFSWTAAWHELEPTGRSAGLNIAHLAVDRHASGPLRDHVALRCLRQNGEVNEFSYGGLAAVTSRFANALDALGVRKGERVFSLLGRTPEQYIAALGTLKHRSVFCPLFSAFGPEPVHQRLLRGDAKVLVTTERQYATKVAALRDALPNLSHVVLVDGAADQSRGIEAFDSLLAAAGDDYHIGHTDPEDMALLHFTSGTTGMPKGAIHVHAAVVAHYWTGKLALDLHGDDVFWCTADPGWVTGTSYGIIAPLTLGVTNVVDEAEFDAERWYRVLEQQRVSVWYTAPTAVRMLMRVGGDVVRQYDTSALRFIASVGEPLNPEAVRWGVSAFGLPIHDNWWQTETGGIMVANYQSMPIRPGSMGRPLPGVRAAIVHRTADGGVEVITEPHVQGELALEPGWPSMFRGYIHEEERYRKCFAGGWYLSGDLATRDEDGYLWFVGRADDVIKSSGHLIGPFEVESVLMEHPAVAEAAVIGLPDPVAGESITAYLTLNRGYEVSEDLKREIRGFARTRLGAAVAPKAIEVLDNLPKTRSGKIMRRLLKARALGLPEGDTSALESSG